MEPGRSRDEPDGVRAEAGLLPEAGAARRFARSLGWAMFWQVLGKLIGVVGLSYAFRCLGPDRVGVSGTVLVAVTFAQLALDFGLDIIAVRHVAARTVTVPDITSALFTLRVLLAGGALGLASVVVGLMPAAAATRWVWWFGVVHLTFLVLGYGWHFQATERMPLYAFLQNATTVATSLVFLAVFRPGQAVGSDIVATAAVNALATGAVWWWIRRRLGVPLFRIASLPLAGRLFREARATWVFNLCYTALISMSLPLCTWFLGDREAGYYRSASMLVSTLQVFLSYFASMLNPRIVQWRAGPPGRLRHRLLILAGTLVGLSVVCLAALWVFRRPVILLLWGREFLPAAEVLPVLVSAKFLAVASGLLVWGLLANYREWLAVACCAPALVGATVLNLVLIPRYGITAAAWLNYGGEFALLLLCLWALNRVEARRARPA